MILPSTRFSISDNSGAKSAECIRIIDARKKLGIGSQVLVSIKQVKKKDKVAKKSLQRGIIVEMKKKECRKDGSSFSSSRNSIVLLTEAKQPIGTRILGLVPYEVREGGYLKLLSLGTYTL